MLVASGIGACSRDLRHAVDAGRRVFEVLEDAVEFAATWIEVSTVQAAFGSSRSGWSGNASRSARMAAISSSGGKTPPLSLIALNPYSSTMRRACSTMASGSSAAPQPSGSRPGCPAHL